MSYNQFNCAAETPFLGIQECTPTMGSQAFLAVVPRDFNFATKSAAETQSNWVAIINATPGARMFVLPKFFNFTDESEQAIYETGKDGKQRKVREGSDMYMNTLETMSMFNYLELRKLNNKGNMAAYIITENGYIKGQSSDGLLFEPRPLSLLNIEKMKEQTDSEDVNVSLKFAFGVGDLYHSKGAIIKPSWNPLIELMDIKLVTLELIGTPTAIEAVVKVTGTADGNEVIGFEASGDFVMTDDGVNKAVTATDNQDGTYTLAYTGGAGVLTWTLLNQPDMVTKFFATKTVLTYTV